MKKISKTIKSIVEWVLVAVALSIVIFTLISVCFFDKNDRSLFGYKIYVCMSDSMKATDFAAGDLLIVREVEPKNLQQGDIISYVSEDPSSAGKIITHKIRNVRKAGAESVFVVYGTTTGKNDELPVTYEQVTGKYLFHIPRLGNFFLFLQTTLGFLLCVFLPLILLFAARIYHSIKLQKAYNEARGSEEMEDGKQENKKGGEESEY